MPRLNHGGGTQSIVDDDDIAQDIKIYLQGVGKFIKAQDIIDFCGTPEMLERFGRTKSISESTARRWLIKMVIIGLAILKGNILIVMSVRMLSSFNSRFIS